MEETANSQENHKRYQAIIITPRILTLFTMKHKYESEVKNLHLLFSRDHYKSTAKTNALALVRDLGKSEN